MVFAAPDVTQLLVNWGKGDKSALDRMTPMVYDELRRLARHFLANERRDHTLEPTALVHEAYIRLVDQRAVDWRNRAQFLGLAASMMRRILINHAAAHNAAKRQGGGIAPLDDVLAPLPPSKIDLLSLDRSLDELTRVDGRQAKVVELRYFGGLSIDETAEVMGLSPATVKREWATARLWLLHRMEGVPLE